MPTKNKEVFQKDPTSFTIPNDGVTKVLTPRSPEELRVLRYELESFVCEGEYRKGLERILSGYLANLEKPTQPAVWVSGFFGSGKSHLVRVLEYLWRDIKFSNGSTARGITRLPQDINDLLQELTTAGKRNGGLWSAAGTLGAGAGSSIRLALLSILLKNADLPEQYAPARLVIWLMQDGYYTAVKEKVEIQGRNFAKELNNMYVSPYLAQALMDVIPNLATSTADARNLLRTQYPNKDDITDDELLMVMRDVLELQSNSPGKLPCTLIVLDELQQFLGEDPSRTLQVQTVVESCSARFGSLLLFVATGQSALQATPQLQKLEDRFTIRVQLADKDVERVVREVVLRKDPVKVPGLRIVLEKAGGEIDRHLVGTRIGPRQEDADDLIPDYPLLPVRRRFWEAVLRAVNPSGTAGQLRTQLRAVHEATKEVADAPLGTVVPGDVIFDQLKPDMLQSSDLPREVAGLIDSQAEDGTEDGLLRARLLATIFLISKLPTAGVAATGLHATPSALADLLVGDLNTGSSSLRQRIPALLENLAKPGGPLIFVDGEYRLQTRESAEWQADVSKRYHRLLADDSRIANDRTTEFRNAITTALKGISLAQGLTKTPRSYELHFAPDAPKANTARVPVWVRDEWSVSEKTVREEAQAAGVDSPIVFVFLPRQEAEALKSTIATYAATQECLDARGVPSTEEGREARSAMQARRDSERNKLDGIVSGILSNAKVFQGGGNEIADVGLAASVKHAIEGALVRLFPRFNLVDHLGWDTVIRRTLDGSADALSAVGYTGDVEKHPACQQIRTFIGGTNKTGGDIRKYFANSPYGWPQDSVDGALLALTAGGFLRASRHSQAIPLKQLNQTALSQAEFQAEEAVVSAVQRIAVRKLLTDMGLQFRPGEEGEAVSVVIQRLINLAEQAGGDQPAPQRPSTLSLQDLRAQSGNRQLISVAEQRDDLLANHQAWTKASSEIAKRKPRWDILQSLLSHASNLPGANEVAPQVRAIYDDRALLSDPDPVTPVISHLTLALRNALQSARQQLADAEASELDALENSQEWQALPEADRQRILTANGLDSVPDLSIGTDEQLLATLDATSLADWEDKLVALPARVTRAREEAARMVLPETVTVRPRKVTLKTPAEVDSYLADLREEIMTHINAGKPVIL